MRCGRAASVSTTTSSTSACAGAAARRWADVGRRARVVSLERRQQGPWRTRRPHSSKHYLVAARQASRGRAAGRRSLHVGAGQPAAEVWGNRTHTERVRAQATRPTGSARSRPGCGGLSRRRPPPACWGRRAASRIPQAASCPGSRGSRPRRAVHRERDPQVLAQGAAVRLVAVGLRAQSVVDVQRARRTAQLDGDVEQADGVALRRASEATRGSGLG